MKTSRAAGLGAILLTTCLLVSGCFRMAPIYSEAPLMPPAGLALNQIEGAIRAGIVRANLNSHGTWAVEKSSPGVLVAGLTQPGDHYLQVTFTYTQVRVISRITGSRNEDQTATAINKRANFWYIRLNEFVQKELVDRAPR